jgi:predicted Zn finger-like uncharacterized protein
MSMFTTCPNCKLHLAVSAGDLRVGQGYVRCGRCDRVFNALLSLGEDPDREPQAGLMATGTITVPALEHTDDAILAQSLATASAVEQAPAAEAQPPAEMPDPVVEPEAEPVPPAQQQTQPEESLDEEQMYVDLSEPEPGDFDAPDEWSKVSPIRPQLHDEVEVEESIGTGTYETIVLEGDTILQTEEHVDETELDAQIQQIASQIEGDELAHVREDLATLQNLQVEELPSEDVVLESPQEPVLDADEAVGNLPRLHWAWTAGAAALVLLLLGQVAHHHRQALVSQAWAESPLRSIYSLFGVTLEPRWDLKAYDLRQLGGETLPGDAAKIVLRATLQNRATSSQPPPMIRVTLQDRFGNALSTTAIAPQDYLRGSAPSRIGADQRLDAQLTLDDPNRQAVGFELDACLPDAAGSLHCSTDP